MTKPAKHRGDALKFALRDAEPLYLLPKDDVAESVLSPALEACERADLMVGFFSSHALAEIAPGLASFLRQSQQSLRLIVSPFLTEEDQAALREGQLTAASLAKRSLDSSIPDANALAHHTLKCLAWLIAEGRLEFKIALMRDALFHPKVWLFHADSELAALHGSANLTAAGLGRNREQLSLSRSWHSHEGQLVCQRLQDEFEMLWGGGDDTCITLDLPRAFRDRLLRDYRTDSMPSEADFRTLWHQAIPNLNTAESPKVTVRPVEFKIPKWLEYRAGDYAHQGDAVDAWRASEWRGILEMCTGSGKTLTAMVGAHELHRQVGSLLVVVTAPYNVLIHQWCDEVAQFGLRPINMSSCAGSKGRGKEIAQARRRLSMNITPVEIVVVSNDTLVSSEFQSQIGTIDGPKLLIADECHNLGSAGFVESPPEMFDYRLGLSATPVRQHDDEGTGKLFAYFGKPCFEFGLDQAIGRCLTPYDYFVHFVSLEAGEMEEWRELSEQIARHSWRIEAGANDDYLNNLFLRRRRVLETANAKIGSLDQLLDNEDLNRLQYTLIYATDKDPNQLNRVNAILTQKNLSFHQLTASETSDSKLSARVLERFQSGKLQVLTAKRVLDEGVNVPQIERAYILASTTVRRQWVQRRGRLLRMCKEIGKTHAIIHDLVTLPPGTIEGEHMDEDAKKIIRSELERIWEFARLSRNGARTGGPFEQVERLRTALLGTN